MSDPIDKLTRLGDALEGAPMPLPASAIRARGDRIRRRKHALVAGASAAVVAAVAVPVVALTLNGSDKPDNLAPQPSGSDPVPTAPISAENLLTSGDAIYPNGGSDWREASTYPALDAPAFSTCSQAALSDLGAEAALGRQFEFVVLATGAVDQTLSFHEVIAEFPSADDAQAAYGEIQSWYADGGCQRMENFEGGELTAVPVDVEATAEAQLATFGPRNEDEGYFADSGFVLSGDRIAVLSQVVPGQDYIWPEGTPVEQMLPAAAERLVRGGGDPAEGPVDGTWPTTIPDTFPLMSGWPVDDGTDEFQLDEPSEDNQAMLPAEDLTACGQSIDGGEPIDRLTARISAGSAYYAREIQLFATPDDAAAYQDSIEDAFVTCAEEPGSPYTFEDGPVLLLAEGVSRQVTMVFRDGNAVFVTLKSDEGGAESVIRLWTEVGENSAGVLEAMDALVRGIEDPGTDPSGDPNLDQPAGTTTIPDDIPLDAAMVDMGLDGEFHTPYRPEATEAGTTVELCGQAVWPAAATVDRLWAWATGPEYGDRRELVTFATVNEAVAAVDAIRVELQGCENEGSVVWTVTDVLTGYDSVTFSRTYTDSLGKDDFQATRVGNAVLLVQRYGEGSISGVEEGAQDRTDVTMAIAPSLCVFSVDGC